MNRRSFLKMIGLSGLAFATNWKSLLRGPRSGDLVVTHAKREPSGETGLLKAGESISAGRILVYGDDGRVYKTMTEQRTMAGISSQSAERDDLVLVFIQGIFQGRAGVISYQDTEPWNPFRSGSS